MKTAVMTSIVFLSLLLPQHLFAQAKRSESSDSVPKNLGPDLEMVLKKSGLPAVAAAAIHNGELVSVGAVGVRKIGDDTPVTIDDKFHIGSCTKAMTATLAAILVEEGLINWDTKPGDVFEKIKIHEGYQDVTLLQLLSNTGGCPGDVPPKLWGKLWKTKASLKGQRMQLVRGILTTKPQYTPGEGQMYSNAGFSIAGAMLENVAKKPWEDLITEKLFKPLGMTSAGFRAPKGKGKLGQPWGHNPSPVKPGPSADNPAAIAPAGAVHCTITDWAKFAKFHLESQPGEIIRKQETFDQLHRIHNQADSYALGWGVANSPGLGTIMQHSGSNSMWYSTIWIVPEKDFAAVSITNAGGPAAATLCDEAIAAMLKRHVLK